MNWFDRIDTEPGKILILLGLILVLLVVSLSLVITGHTPQQEGRTALSESFTAVFTALMMKLSTKNKEVKNGSSTV